MAKKKRGGKKKTKSQGAKQNQNAANETLVNNVVDAQLTVDPTTNGHDAADATPTFPTLIEEADGEETAKTRENSTAPQVSTPEEGPTDTTVEMNESPYQDMNGAENSADTQIPENNTTDEQLLTLDTVPSIDASPTDEVDPPEYLEGKVSECDEPVVKELVDGPTDGTASGDEPKAANDETKASGVGEEVVENGKTETVEVEAKLEEEAETAVVDVGKVEETFEEEVATVETTASEIADYVVDAAKEDTVGTDVKVKNGAVVSDPAAVQLESNAKESVESVVLETGKTATAVEEKAFNKGGDLDDDATKSTTDVNGAPHMMAEETKTDTFEVENKVEEGGETTAIDADILEQRVNGEVETSEADANEVKDDVVEATEEVVSVVKESVDEDTVVLDTEVVEMESSTEDATESAKTEVSHVVEEAVDSVQAEAEQIEENAEGDIETTAIESTNLEEEADTKPKDMAEDVKGDARESVDVAAATTEQVLAKPEETTKDENCNVKAGELSEGTTKPSEAEAAIVAEDVDEALAPTTTETSNDEGPFAETNKDAEEAPVMTETEESHVEDALAVEEVTTDAAVAEKTADDEMKAAEESVEATETEAAKAHKAGESLEKPIVAGETDSIKLENNVESSVEPAVKESVGEAAKATTKSSNKYSDSSEVNGDARDDSAPITTFFSLEELKAGVEGVEYSKREQYLSTDDFESLFGMSKKDFKAMRLWRQRDQKKKVGLF